MLDGKLWYDIPFAYEPYWEKRSGKTYAQRMAEDQIPIKR